MEKNNILVIILVAVLVGTGAFFGGIKYQQSKQPAFSRQFGGGQGARNGQGGTAGLSGDRRSFRPVNGEIISTDDKSITVKMQDGSSRIVMLSDKTEINKAASGTKDDLKVGEKVAVFGTDNTDGSVTAQNIQLNPQFRAGPTPTTQAQ